MNLNLHFHTLALDGAYLYDPRPGATPEFVRLPPPNGHDVARVLVAAARRLVRPIEARAEGDEDSPSRDEPLLALLAQASLRTRIATGPEAGQRWRRLGDRTEPSTDESPEGEAPAVVARVILESMDLPARAPPACGASSEPTVEPTPSLEETPAFDFDQTSPYDEG